MFCVCIDHQALATNRQAILAHLLALGINAGIHYPAIHLFSLYRRLGYREGNFPNAERIGEQTITLPLFPGMTEQDVDHVCHSVNSVINNESL